MLQCCQSRQKLSSPVFGVIWDRRKENLNPDLSDVIFPGAHSQVANNVTDPALSPFRLTSRSKSVDKSQEEFPKELMEDWSTMEVCVDCKKFISEIISSSRRSLSLANKRARLKRKTQSFYMSSPGSSEYCPSERTINEI